MSDDPDRLTKPEACARLHVGERTLDQLVKAGKLDPRRWRAPGGRQWRTVFLAEDVDRLALERQGGPPTPFLVPGPAKASNGNGHTSDVSITHTREGLSAKALAVPSGEDILRLVFALAQRTLTGEGPQAPQGPQGPQALYLDVEQAAALLYWTPRKVRRAIRDGELPCRFKEQSDWRTWRIRRIDLEAL